MNRKTYVLFVGCFAVLACRGPRREFTPVIGGGFTATTGGGQTVTTGGAHATGSAQQQLEELDGVLRGQGFQALGPAVHGSLQANGLIAYAVDAQPGACYTLAALGEDPSSENIDMIVLDPLGRPAGYNVRPDSHPWASFCSALQGRFIARVQMAGGQGSYFYAAYAGPPGRRMELSEFFGQTAEQGPQVAQLDAQTQARVTALDQRLAPQGFTRTSPPVGLMLTQNVPRDFQLNLTQGQCYAFGALGGQGAIDADLILNDPTGAQAIADTDTARDAFVQYCAPQSGTYSLQARLQQGQGALFAVAYVQNAAAGQGSQQPVMATTSTAAAGLTENFALLDADMRARGYEGYGQQTTDSLQEGGVRSFEIDLEGGKCYAILAVGDPSVRNLDLQLLDASGRALDRDDGPDARPTVRVCPQANGHFNMQVRMTSGSGQFVYAPYRWPRGTHGPFGLSGLIYVRLAEVTALLDVEGFEPDPGFTPVSGRLAREGATASQNVALSAGQCYAVVVVGGDGVNDLDVTLSLQGQQLATNFGTRTAFPSVRHCAQQDGRYTATITASSGAGAYHMQLFHREGAAQQ